MQNSIDRLPNELLISIISRLPFKEAGRTSVLARRWRNIWTSNSVLDFDASKVLCKLKDQEKIQDETIRFVKWVNKVTVFHSLSAIDEFRILFDLDSTHAHHIDTWILFAFSKRVKRLELHLLLSCCVDGRNERYNLPNMWDPIERLRISPYGLSSCKSLEKLCLTGVHVTGEVLEFFISNCPFLEELFVKDSNSLQSLRMSSTRLRDLKILNCKGFRMLDIYSPSLVSFTFYGDRIPMDLKNVSSLINLSLGAKRSLTLASILVQISRCLSRLETLELCPDAIQVNEIFPFFPDFPKLNKLVLDIHARGHEKVFWLPDIINAAPLLCILVLKLQAVAETHAAAELFGGTRSGDGGRFTWSGPEISRKVLSQHRNRHDSLKVLQIVGFAGRTTDVEMAKYVIDHAVSLEKVVIHLQRPLEGEQGIDKAAIAIDLLGSASSIALSVSTCLIRHIDFRACSIIIKSE
ncbi:hypothetical protein BUALT_Bualt07G0039700 [Buddleja alternifolia]|uniref:F-box domain-containing protein n=1 Tax=Buddleja alternifolia TaxID=168488 RepID=A0AAV6X9B7_9LAMI|nr:hypothetical protein BUALT_Bualt07G0039700 [Buddleja alternifolia]